MSTSSGTAAVSFPSNHKYFPSFLFTCLLPQSSHPAPFCHSHLLHPNPQIKRFLEDTSDDAELSKFVKEFPGSEPCHPPEPKTRVSRPPVLEARPQTPELCDDDVDFRGSLWPQPSDSQQYFSAPAPLSPSSRPRSPWGKLDPYDSSEVETLDPPLPLSGWMQNDPGRAEREPGVAVWTCASASNVSVGPFCPASSLALWFLP